MYALVVRIPSYALVPNTSGDIDYDSCGTEFSLDSSDAEEFDRTHKELEVGAKDIRTLDGYTYRSLS